MILRILDSSPNTPSLKYREDFYFVFQFVILLSMSFSYILIRLRLFFASFQDFWYSSFANAFNNHLKDSFFMSKQSSCCISYL